MESIIIRVKPREFDDFDIQFGIDLEPEGIKTNLDVLTFMPSNEAEYDGLYFLATEDRDINKTWGGVFSLKDFLIWLKANRPEAFEVAGIKI